MAAITTKRDNQPFCGATIIDSHYALTAAHCINTAGHYANEIELLVGDHDYRNRMEFFFSRKKRRKYFFFKKN